jgi:hypothetical protein
LSEGVLQFAPLFCTIIQTNDTFVQGGRPAVLQATGRHNNPAPNKPEGVTGAKRRDSTDAAQGTAQAAAANPTTNMLNSKLSLGSTLQRHTTVCKVNIHYRHPAAG